MTTELYTRKQIENGEGLLTTRRTTIWTRDGVDEYRTTDDGESCGSPWYVWGYGWPDGTVTEC